MYDENVQHAVEAAMVSHAARSTHLDELMPITPGLHSPAKESAWNDMPDTLVREVQEYKGKFKQATR